MFYITVTHAYKSLSVTKLYEISGWCHVTRWGDILVINVLNKYVIVENNTLSRIIKKHGFLHINLNT